MSDCTQVLRLYTAASIKEILEHIMADFHIVYVMRDGEGPRQEASQQEVMRVVIGRVADVLGIDIDMQPPATLHGSVDQSGIQNETERR
jgi:hypothetical protein